jgi:hypothetical protein
MKNTQTLTLSKSEFTFHILDSIETKIEITENPYQLPIEELFTMAARINKKRSFLFVSKVLGKHMPIDPNKGLLTAALLAARFIEKAKNRECNEKEKLLSSFLLEKPLFCSQSFISKNSNPIIIGFAETATALGHAFFDCFQSANYFHTTREEIPYRESEITFEEEHSHATAHRCYITREMLRNNREIILVDDEMTTGKTALNIIQSIHSKFPRGEYTVVSILDWRSEENKHEFKQLEKNLGITINVICLLAGHVKVKQVREIKERLTDNEQSEKAELTVDFLQLSSFFTADPCQDQVPYIQETGRFGLRSEANQSIQQKISKAATFLKQKRSGEKTLCLGTGEFMYIPMKIASKMGKGIYYQSTTRSPVFIQDKEGYGARSGIAFANPEDQAISNFVYNIPSCHYDELFIFFEREVDNKSLESLLRELEKIQLKSVKFVFFSKEVRTMQKLINQPAKIGTYREEDVLFLLKDLSHIKLEDSILNRELRVQSGIHYSESLPIEYQPPKEYVDLFWKTLMDYKQKVALCIGIVAEQIYQLKGDKAVLVSLARAGTPVGILIKRYIEMRYQVTLPHYSISIIRDRGIDENALQYILAEHPAGKIQFVDGWTGKGAISLELIKACQDFEQKYGFKLDATLAVIADPGHCTPLFGTREDFLIPSACLNSTVSGLVSRTVLNDKYIGKADFHGAKFYDELIPADISNEYIDLIVSEFDNVSTKAVEILSEQLHEKIETGFFGMAEVEKIQAEFGIESSHYIKPGVGETTRVLLRRVPWKILMRDPSSPFVKHILLLAEEKGVEIVEYKELSYLCCGLIKSVKEIKK